MFVTSKFNPSQVHLSKGALDFSYPRWSHWTVQAEAETVQKVHVTLKYDQAGSFTRMNQTEECSTSS